jgi:hypothetical protein
LNDRPRAGPARYARKCNTRRKKTGQCRCVRRSCRPERRRDSYDAKANNGLAGFCQLNGLGTTAGRASTSASKQNGGVEVRVVGLRFILGPAPLTQGTLVNEGEGRAFVCHTRIRCQIGQKVKLRKYRGAHCYLGHRGIRVATWFLGRTAGSSYPLRSIRTACHPALRGRRFRS